jgi:hypothetical protein
LLAVYPALCNQVDDWSRDEAQVVVNGQASLDGDPELKAGKHILVISVAWWNAVLRIRET